MLRRKVPSTNSLFAFEVVARHGSFSSAAAELNVTQPAVSRTINSLEKHLGYRLFIRHGRWIDLTPNGAQLFRVTTSAFNTIEDTLSEINVRNESQERVSISMSSTAVNFWFVPRMQSFKARFPTVSLKFQTFDVEADAKDADLSVRLSDPAERSTHRWPFADERVLAVCSPEYLDKFGTLDEQKIDQNHTILEATNQRYSLGEYIHTTGRAALVGQQTMVFSDNASIIQAAVEGHGIALGWLHEISQPIITGSLTPASTQIVKTGRRFHVLATNLTPMRPIVEDIRDWLIKEMRGDLNLMKEVLRTRLIKISVKRLHLNHA